MRKPKIIVSKCLCTGNCRYDGSGNEDKVIELLKDYIDIETVCPEQSIGLSTPRDPLRIETHDNENRIIQLKSNKDYTSLMTEFADDFFNNIDDVDGFILKSRSPSCGLKDVKIYPKGQKCAVKKNGTGIFASNVIKYHKECPIENEGRLKNYAIRDEFLTKIFTINDLKCEKSIKDFHEKNILLLTSYDKDITENLSTIISKKDLSEEDIRIYKNTVYDILNRNRPPKNKILTCKTIFNRYKSRLNKNEIDYFERLINSYNDNKIPFSCIIVALQMYAVRFDDEKILTQTFFSPYPEELVSVTDSGKGREI